MIYNEKLIGTAGTVRDLITILCNDIPNISATLELTYPICTSNVEVWYDEVTNTVILK